MKRITATAAVLALLALPASEAPAEAQQKGVQDPDNSVQFNLSTPGARSLGLGGAFLALADDATAAYTNPAGLTNLTVGGSEATLEARTWRYSNPYLERGHEDFLDLNDLTPATGQGVDTVDGLQFNDSKSEVSGLSFLSYAHVFKGGLTLAFYRHELANFSSAIATQGYFYDSFAVDDNGTDNPFDDFIIGEVDQNGNFIITPFLFRSDPKRSVTDLEIFNYGASGALEFKAGKEGSLSVGAGVSIYQMDLESLTEYFDYSVSPRGFVIDDNGTADPSDDQVIPDDEGDPGCQDPSERAAGCFFGPPDYSPDNSYRTVTQTGDDTDFGLNVGVLWKIGKLRRWSVGGVFRQGPDFETRFTTRDCVNGFPDAENVSFEEGPPFEKPCNLVDEAPFPFGDGQPDDVRGSITVPDIYGLGAAFRSEGGRTKLLLDVNHVKYSQRETDLLIEVDAGTETQFRYKIDDATQVHLGFERLVLVVESLFVGTVRVGVWREPYHGVEFTGTTGDPRIDRVFRSFIPEPEDQIHASLGFGLVVKEDYQIDAAVNVSGEGNDTFSISLVKFF